MSDADFHRSMEMLNGEDEFYEELAAWEANRTAQDCVQDIAEYLQEKFVIYPRRKLKMIGHNRIYECVTEQTFMEELSYIVAESEVLHYLEKDREAKNASTT